MNQIIQTIQTMRSSLMQHLDGLSIDQLNTVPPGFNNNIVWHLGHLIAAQQGILYLRSGLPMHIAETFFNQYKPGTKPEGALDAAAIDQIKSDLFTTLEKTEADLQAQRFTTYNAWTTRYGVALNSFEDALQFLQWHEGFHAGYVFALKRAVAVL